MGNVNQFLAVLRQRLNDQYIQDWSSALENSSRARFHRNIAGSYLQLYLEFITIRKFRVAMAIHRLEVDTDRWTRHVTTPFYERKCHMCDKLEDEFHLLFIVR